MTTESREFDPLNYSAWYMVSGSRKAHLLVTDPATMKLWRPLCQDSDVASSEVRRKASNSDELCSTCRYVLSTLVQIAVRKRRLLGATENKEEQEG